MGAYSGVLNVGWLLGSTMSINSLLFFHNKRSSSYTILQRVCFNAGLQIWIFISRHYIYRSPLIIIGRTAPVYQFLGKAVSVKSDNFQVYSKSHSRVYSGNNNKMNGV